MVDVGSIFDGDQGTRTLFPATEGEYEYVCTFPGHWAIMWGKLIVTKDVDAYLQAHPVADAVPAGAPVDHSQHQHASLGK